MGLGVVGFSNPSTWILIVTIGISTYSMGKHRVQEIMASSTPPLIGYGSLMVVTTCSFQKLVVTIDACIGENLWEIVLDSLIKFFNKLVICITIKL
jgi:hypothetical protein